MKVLVVSDTHRKNDNFFRVLKKVGPVDMVIHCGDIEGGEYAIATSAECRVEMVAGNNDFFSPLPMEREFEVAGYRIWVTHGHHYYVSMGNERLKQEARARGVDIVFYGHTHRPVVEIEDDVIAVNPGSISYPRQDEKKPSYVIMEVDRFGKAYFMLNYL